MQVIAADYLCLPLMAMLEQVGLGGWTALKLRQKAVQWLKTNGNRPMDDGKVIAADLR